MWTSFSTAVGGGVRGKGDGIARGAIVQVGATIKTFHLFIKGYLQVGRMTTASIVGKGINGTINEYLTIKFNGTGATGKRADIGRRKIRGVSKVWKPEREHSRNPGRCHNHSDLAKSNRSDHSLDRSKPERGQEEKHDRK
jgi:hypothetical protein